MILPLQNKETLTFLSCVRLTLCLGTQKPLGSGSFGDVRRPGAIHGPGNFSWDPRGSAGADTSVPVDASAHPDP